VTLIVPIRTMNMRRLRDERGQSIPQAVLIRGSLYRIVEIVRHGTISAEAPGRERTDGRTKKPHPYRAARRGHLSRDIKLPFMSNRHMQNTVLLFSCQVQ